jgi:hypothetical protein
MQYDVYVQENFYKTIEAETTGHVLRQVAQDIHDGKVSVNNDIPQNIRIEPKP